MKPGEVNKDRMTPIFDKENQIIDIETELSNGMGKAFTESIDFKGNCVRNALIKLGWIPPND